MRIMPQLAGMTMRTACELVWNMRLRLYPAAAPGCAPSFATGYRPAEPALVTNSTCGSRHPFALVVGRMPWSRGLITDRKPGASFAPAMLPASTMPTTGANSCRCDHWDAQEATRRDFVAEHEAPSRCRDGRETQQAIGVHDHHRRRTIDSGHPTEQVFMSVMTAVAVPPDVPACVAALLKAEAGRTPPTAAHRQGTRRQVPEPCLPRSRHE